MRNSGGGNFAAFPVPIQKRKGNVAKQRLRDLLWTESKSGEAR